MVISNHQSELDPWLVGSAVHKKVIWLSKKENFDIPIFKSIIRPFGTIPIKRGQSDTEALDKVRAELESGGCIGMFPEGTRSPDGELAPFHSGAAKLCLETSVPYVPCAIFGAYKVFPKHASLSKIKMRDGSIIKIVIGKPVYMDPSMEINYENIQKVKDEMRKDVLLLQSGEMNVSRIIREGISISIDQDQVHIDEEVVSITPSKKIEDIVPSRTLSKEIGEKISDPTKDFSHS